MFRAIGTVILIAFLVQIFGSAAKSFEAAMVSTFDTINVAAQVSQSQLNSRR